jgi:DNA polymerase-3 subunit delta'
LKLATIVGHEAPLRRLRDAVGRRRLAHALVFAGPEGIGKWTTARSLAAWLLCEKDAADACETCGSCRMVASASEPARVQHGERGHPDLLLEDLRLDDKARPPKLRKNILIEQAKEVRDFVGARSLGGGRKIAIVNHAERMTDEGANALLKTLEEPPAQSLIVLVAAKAGALLPTVRSRCQRIDFAPLARGAIERALVERFGRSPSDARLLAFHADGSLGVAVTTDVARLREARARILADLDRVAGRSWPDLASAAAPILAQLRTDSKRAERRGRDEGDDEEPTPGEPSALGLLIAVLRERVHAAAGIADAAPDDRGRRAWPLASALAALEAAADAAEDLRRNANQSLAVEAMWLRIGRALAA